MRNRLPKRRLFGSLFALPFITQLENNNIFLFVIENGETVASTPEWSVKKISITKPSVIQKKYHPVYAVINIDFTIGQEIGDETRDG